MSESKVLKIFVVIRDGYNYIDYINYIESQSYLQDRVFKDQGKVRTYYQPNVIGVVLATPNSPSK